MSYVMKCDHCGNTFVSVYFGIKTEIDSVEFRMAISKSDMKVAAYHEKHYCSWQCASEEAKILIFEEVAKL